MEPLARTQLQPFCLRRRACASAAGLVLSGVGLSLAERGAAAVVQKVNEDHDEIVLELSQAELEPIEEGDWLLLEVGKERFIVAGTVIGLNTDKQIALVEFEDSEERFQKKQTVRFLSFFWNKASSPLMTSYGQFHQYSRSFFEGRAGPFFGQLKTKQEGSETKADTSGTTLGVEGYALLSPQLVGIGAGFERRSATTKISGDADSETEQTSNQLRFGGWYEPTPGMRIGLRYDYTMGNTAFDSEDMRYTYDVILGEPRLGVTWYGRDYETGFDYKDKDEFDSDYTIEFDSGDRVPTKAKVKVPADLTAYYRKASSPVFAWSSRLGYTFYERPNSAEAKVKISEKIHMQAAVENRGNKGQKFEAGLVYDGAKTKFRVGDLAEVNSAGFFATYQSFVWQSTVVGGTITLAAGSRSSTTNGEVSVDETRTGFGASLLLFAARDFDVDMRRRKGI